MSAGVLFEALAAVDMDYAVAGSLAASAYGECGAGAQIDLVARFTEPQLDRLSAMLGAGYHFDLDSAKGAMRAGRAFHIVSLRDAMRFDFRPAGACEFNESVLARKRRVRVEFLSNLEIPLVIPEDLGLLDLR